MNNDAFLKWCQPCASSGLSTVRKQRPLIMGVVNITPDSFSDGGCFMASAQALKHALTLIEQGADIIDVGGESSRPGALQVSCQEELDRVIPVIHKLRDESDVCISIDTSKALVMKEAVAAGANIINDIQALQGENSLDTAASLNVPICLMHMQGEPQTMQQNPMYQQDIVSEINAFFGERIKACISAAIPKEYLLLDPGFGFGKTVAHNLQLIKEFNRFQIHDCPLLLGVSRKSTIGNILNKPIYERLVGGLTIAVFAALNGMNMIRTHDVEETQQAFAMLAAIHSCGDELNRNNQT